MKIVISISAGLLIYYQILEAILRNCLLWRSSGWRFGTAVSLPISHRDSQNALKYDVAIVATAWDGIKVEARPRKFPS